MLDGSTENLDDHPPGLDAYDGFGHPVRFALVLDLRLVNVGEAAEKGQQADALGCYGNSLAESGFLDLVSPSTLTSGSKVNPWRVGSKAPHDSVEALRHVPGMRGHILRLPTLFSAILGILLNLLLQPSRNNKLGRCRRNHQLGGKDAVEDPFCLFENPSAETDMLRRDVEMQRRPHA